jgi:enamidase
MDIVTATPTTLLKNLRGVVTGDLADPFLETEVLLIEGARITSLNPQESEADVVIDAAGAVAIPGLIDTHAHVVFGDFTPRQNTVGWIESYMHGGVTHMMSASEVHLPGRPTDPVGVKALAITAQRSYQRVRPGGVKVIGGSIICEPGLTRQDLEELAGTGVRLMKVGFGHFDKVIDAAPIVGWARDLEYIVMAHSGGASIPGSYTVTVDDLITLHPNIAGHINGGTTSLPESDLKTLIETTDIALQIVQAGNLRSALFIVKEAMERDQQHRLTVGTDTPSGTGVMPLGMLKTIVEITALAGLPPEMVVSFATGNSSKLLRISEGVLHAGGIADLVLIQEPLGGVATEPLSAMRRGDLPGIAAVMIDGQVRALRSRNTPSPAREVKVLGERSGGLA